MKGGWEEDDTERRQDAMHLHVRTVVRAGCGCMARLVTSQNVYAFLFSDQESFNDRDQKDESGTSSEKSCLRRTPGLQ